MMAAEMGRATYVGGCRLLSRAFTSLRIPPFGRHVRDRSGAGLTRPLSPPRGTQARTGLAIDLIDLSPMAPPWPRTVVDARIP